MHEAEPILDSARRQLGICNACRYCEGYCAVFPALERGPLLTDGDVTLLASICHDCRACFQACMYAPPHEFDLDLPRALTAVRESGYETLVWPSALRHVVRHPVLANLTALCVGIGAALAAVGLKHASLYRSYGDGKFYAAISGTTMSVFFVLWSLLVAVLLTGTFVKFLSTTARERGASLGLRAILMGLRDAATLRNLGGGEDKEGCYYPEADRPSAGRKICHHLLAYGMLSAFAATVAAAVEQHVLGHLPPYNYLSVPVALGAIGGISMTTGAAGLTWLRSRIPIERRVTSGFSEYVFLIMLEIVAISGILLLTIRSTAIMPTVLVFHLGAVTGLLILLPYGKFVHAIHRTAALLVDAAERRSDY